MRPLIDMLCLQVLTAYIVDLSGWTETWKRWLCRLLHCDMRDLRPMRPFDCSLCCTWWSCIIYLIATGHVTLPYIAAAGMLAMLTRAAGYLMQGLVDVLYWIIDITTSWTRH